MESEENREGNPLMWREGPAEKPPARRRETPCLWLTDLLGGGGTQLVSEDGADENLPGTCPIRVA